ncbi:MAG: hypothetical protein QOD07_2388 [Frankiaceae bacterium]|jgi:hypothetical protein|nr:hypothetical protein [Frankiaceae bacterium]
MRTRSAVAVLAAITLVAAPAAGAATKKKPATPPKKTYCNLLVDSTPGDENWNLVPVVSSPGLDIKSGDIATGAKQVVAVLRLGSVDFSPTSDHYAYLGYSWAFAADSTLGQEYSFTASEAFGNPVKGAAVIDGQSVPVTFSIDSSSKSFKWVVERKNVPSLGRPKNVFKNFRAHSDVESGTADDAPSMPASDTYPDRGLSCLKPS